MNNQTLLWLIFVFTILNTILLIVPLGRRIR